MQARDVHARVEALLGEPVGGRRSRRPSPAISRARPPDSSGWRADTTASPLGTYEREPPGNGRDARYAARAEALYSPLPGDERVLRYTWAETRIRGARGGVVGDHACGLHRCCCEPSPGAPPEGS